MIGFVLKAFVVVLAFGTVRQADLEKRDDAGRTPLMLAVLHDDVETATGLIAAGADVDAVDAYGRTALIIAAQSSLRSVRLLIAAGADISVRDDVGTSALTVAVEAGRTDIVSELRAAGATESLEEQLDDAVRAGNRTEVARLIDAGADVDALDTSSYQTPLMTAIERRDLEMVLVLLDAGADPAREGTGIETTGENALTFAARQGSTWVFLKLLQAGARSDVIERAAIAGCRHRDVLRAALGSGVHVNSRGPRGFTLLMCAASAGAAETVSFLIDSGADLRAQSDDGRTALDWAELGGHSEAAARLRQALARRR
ncbi:MAG TPA: ankyrin repeat domain-containing protein [Vicinamibacteria bacterium]|nr:ankyrin repeat domain-containing protein [Vicinamibacteria bacterium]